MPLPLGANTAMEMLEHVLLGCSAATETAGTLSDFIHNGDAGYGGIEKQKLLLLIHIYNNAIHAYCYEVLGKTVVVSWQIGSIGL